MSSFIEFINKIRESDNAAKKRWLIIFTAPTMLFIIIFWAFMLRSDLALSEVGAIEKKSNFAESRQVFKRGAAIIAERFKQGGSILNSALNERLLRINEVSPNNLKFNSEEVEPVAPKRLNK